jgi:hypothetical protein
MPQQSGRPRALTPELLRQLQTAPARLAAYSVVPTAITVVDAVEVIYQQIQHLQANGYGWREIHACLAAEITLFDFAKVPLSTLQAAYYATLKRFEPNSSRSRKRGRKLNRLISGSPPVAAPESIVSAIELTPVTTHEKLSSQPIAPVSEPVSNAPVQPRSTPAQSQSDANQSSSFTPEELEVALQIPNREDEVAVERFCCALRQLKAIDGRRWRSLSVAARNAEIRLGETTVQCSTQQLNQMFNQY